MWCTTPIDGPATAPVPLPLQPFTRLPLPLPLHTFTSLPFGLLHTRKLVLREDDGMLVDVFNNQNGVDESLGHGDAVLKRSSVCCPRHGHVTYELGVDVTVFSTLTFLNLRAHACGLCLSPLHTLCWVLCQPAVRAFVAVASVGKYASHFTHLSTTQHYDVAVSGIEKYLRVRDIHESEDLVSHGLNNIRTQICAQ